MVSMRSKAILVDNVDGSFVIDGVKDIVVCTKGATRVKVDIRSCDLTGGVTGRAT